jgi:hypothetical protein
VKGSRAGTAGATSSFSPEASALGRMEGIGGGGSFCLGGALGGEPKRARDTCRRRAWCGELGDDIVPLWFEYGLVIALSVKPRARMGGRVGRINVGGRSMSVNVDEELDFVVLSSSAGENAASSAAGRFLKKAAEGVLNGSELRPRPMDS